MSSKHAIMISTSLVKGGLAEGGSPANGMAAKHDISQDMATQDMAAQDMATQDKNTQDKASQDKASQDKAAEDKAARDRAARDKAARDKLALARAALPFRERLITEIPNLRAFARSLSGSVHAADDLVQDTLLKAWSHSDSFVAGSNMRAWLFTILRNTYYSLYRRRGREVQDIDGIYAGKVAVPAGQDSAIDLADLRIALAKLPEDQREVLIMVGATGLSYDETAEICGVAVGTIKSRVNRARIKLAELLGIVGPDDVGPDSNPVAVIKASPNSFQP